MTIPEEKFNKATWIAFKRMVDITLLFSWVVLLILLAIIAFLFCD